MEERFRSIDLEHWPRRQHYELVRQYGLPFFSITTAIDVTLLRNAIREHSSSFTTGLAYVLARAANAIPQFRQRIREAGPVEYEIVHPGLTILCEGDVFRVCLLRYVENFHQFTVEASRAVEDTSTAELLKPESFGNDADRDDVLFMSAHPWFSYSGFFHPLPLNPLDSVPRFAWGSFEERDKQLVMPLTVQAHHALIDGVHFAKFIKETERLIQIADSIL